MKLMIRGRWMMAAREIEVEEAMCTLSSETTGLDPSKHYLFGFSC